MMNHHHPPVLGPHNNTKQQEEVSCFTYCKSEAESKTGRGSQTRSWCRLFSHFVGPGAGPPYVRPTTAATEPVVIRDILHMLDRRRRRRPQQRWRRRQSIVIRDTMTTTADGSAGGGGGGVVVLLLLLLLPVIMVNKSIQNILMKSLEFSWIHWHVSPPKKTILGYGRERNGTKKKMGHKNWFIFPKILSILHWKLNEEFGILEFTKTAVFAENLIKSLVWTSDSLFFFVCYYIVVVVVENIFISSKNFTILQQPRPDRGTRP